MRAGAAFGDLLRILRTRANVTQEELARRSGLSVHAISMLERGVRQAPRQFTVDALAGALGLDLAERHELIAARSPRAAPDGGTATPAVTATPATGPLAVDRVGGNGATVPRQLPVSVRHFTGRVTEMAALTGLFRSRPRHGAGRVAVIAGMAGIGKTALAVRWAHRAAPEFPDGQLYVNLRGFDDSSAPMPPATVLWSFLSALRVAPEHIPADEDGRAALYRSLVADKRLLVVLDNARDVAQVRPLLPGCSGCLVLVTSRSDMIGLVVGQGALPVELAPLDGADEHLLLCRIVGRDRVTTEASATAALIEACGRLPLALTIVAAQAVARPDAELAALAAGVRDAGGRLAALETGDAATSIRAVFSWSYRNLSAPAARMFRMLGLHPGVDLSLATAASLVGADPGAAGRALAELTRVHMVTAQPGGRFDLHDLLWAYATEQALRVDATEQRDRAVARMMDHYLHTAYAAALLFQAGRAPLELAPPRPDVTVTVLADRDSALAWLDRQRPALLALVDRAATARLDRETCQLVWALAPYLDRHGFWAEWAACERQALAAAERLGDPRAQAHTHQRLGHLHGRLGALATADEHLDTALWLFRRAGDRVGEARAHMSWAWRQDHHGRPDDALDHIRRAAALFRAADDRTGQLDALSALGWLYAKLGDYPQGLAECERARDLYREIEDPLGEAAVWDSIGYINHKMGRHGVAVECYHRCMELVDRLGGRLHRAEVRLHLGNVHHATGDLPAARDVWQQALVGFDELHHPEAARLRARLAALDSGAQLPSGARVDSGAG